MCRFVTVYVPSTADLVAVEDVLVSHGIGFRVLDNPNIPSELRRGVVQILASTGWCDCDTPLGAATRVRVAHVPDDRHIEKLRGKGWGGARIQRWLDEKALASDRRRATAAEHLATHENTLEHWETAIRKILDSRRAEWLGVVVHMYNGRIEDDEIQLADRLDVSVGKLGVDVLRNLNEETLLRVQR